MANLTSGRNRRCAALLAVVTLFALGCPRAEKQPTPEVATFVSYVELPGLKATHHRGLQTELALLTAERATPKLMDADAQAAITSPAAVDLNEVLTEAYNTSAVELATRRGDKLFDAEGFHWDPIHLQRAFHLRQQYDAGRVTIRAALAKPDVHLTLELSQGVGLSVAFADAARVYNRMEMFYAAEQLTRGDLAGAMETVAVMFSLCDLLGQQPHVVSRLAAAESRREALMIVQAIATNSAVAATELEQLRQMIGSQLTNWPDDAEAWIGDRATGLHMYEMIRDGHLLSLLTGEELVENRGSDGLGAFIAAAMRSIDADEHFYLQSMRGIVASCQHPYFQRGEVFNKLRRQLGDLQKTPEYPLIADRLLLQNIEEAQRRQAIDRAWTEAWANALAVALAQGELPYELNPATGRPYKVYFEDGNVTVTHIDPDVIGARIVVPM